MLEVDKSRKQRLRACEMVLVEHMEEFVRVGLALKEIRDDRLYEAIGCSDFKDYLNSKKGDFEYSKRHAYQLIESAELRTKLPNAPVEHSWTERSVRELKRLPADTKAKAVAARVVKEVEKSGGRLTSKLVRKHVDQALGVNHKPKPRRKPSFHEEVFKWTGELNGIADLIEGVPSDALELFGKERRQQAKDLAKAIERIEKSLARVWAVLP